MTTTEQSTDDIINDVLDKSFGTNASTTNQHSNGVDDVLSETTAPVDTTQAGEGESILAGNTGGTTRTGSDTHTDRSTQSHQDRTTTQQASRTEGMTGQQAHVPAGRVRDDGKGNLVDEQGRTVAARGAERRWYSEAQAAGRQARQAQQELQELRGKVQPYEQAFATFANLQLTPQEVAVGANLYKSFRTNPRETIEYLIGEARKTGVSIDGAVGSLDINAVRSTVLEALKPILDERAERTRTAEQDAAADREYTEFMSDPDFPNAYIHEAEIAATMRYNPRLSMREAYLKLEAEAVRNGLDFSQPLRPQWEAKRNANVGSNNGTNTGRPPRAPLPNTRMSGSASTVGTSRMAPASMSTSDIVREALRDAGIS